MLFSSDEDAPAIVKIIGPAVIPELATSEEDALSYLFSTHTFS